MDPEELMENEVDLEDDDEETTSDEEDNDQLDNDDDNDLNEDSQSETDSSDEDDDDDDDDETENNVEMNGHIQNNKLGDEEYKQKLKELEDSIQANKYQYQSYVDVIKLTRDQEDSTKLKEYRKQMSELFPLTESLWLDWLRDEQKYNTDRKILNDLFEKAIQDYLSVEIWSEYISYSIGEMCQENGVDKIRSLCERACSLPGFEYSKGNFIWGAYRDFERAILSGYQAANAGSIQTPEQTKSINEQINRIANIFKRELAVCLESTESTFKEFQEFDESLITNELKQTYEKTLVKLKLIEPFEKALKSASEPGQKLKDYFAYIDSELKLIADLEKTKIKQNNKINDQTLDELKNDLEYHRKHLKCLFERAIADDSNCLDVSLWLKYIHYLNEEEGFVESNENQREYNLRVAKRSIRNCPWSAKLWINYGLLLERINSEVDVVKQVFNDAMNAGLQTSDDYLQIWHAYLDFMKRLYLKSETKSEEKVEELREIFQKAINQLFDYFRHQGDPTFSLEKYWSLCEAKYFKSMEQCRKIYNEMILAKSDHYKYASIWIEFYDLEKQFGDEKHQRKLLNRALNEVVSPEDKETIYALLVKFEKLNGSVQQYSNVYYKYEHFKLEQEKLNQELKNKKFEAKKDNQKNQKQKPQQQQFKKEEKPPHSKSEESTKTLKRKVSEPDAADLRASEPKKQVLIKDKDGFAVPSLPVSAIVQNEKSKPVASTKIETKSTPSVEDYKKFSNLTVFISNLSYNVDEAKLKAVFENQPGFKDIRIVKHWSGKTKGYGYVDFETAEQATDALKLDRSLVDGRPVFVSKNEDKSLDFGQNKLKFSASLEKNKLFVSGLPFTTQNKDLEEIFKAFGKLKEVRIVTYKNGKSKGLAYVDFEDEQSAKNALLKTDGMLIGEHQISVAISNPPKRKIGDRSEQDTEEKKQQISSSLGSGSFKSTSAPASAPTVVSFMPRSQLIGQRKAKIDFKK